MAGSDLYTGSLDLLILKSLQWGTLHGYAIARWIRQWTADILTIQEGALYPALHRLESRGLLVAEWGTSESGREVKCYALTRAGRNQLKAEAVRWQAYARVVGAALAATHP